MFKPFFVMCFISISCSALEDIDVVTGISPPYVQYDGSKPSGLLIDLFEDISEKLNLNPKYHVLPTVRMVEGDDVLNKPVIILTLIRLPAREENYLWIGPTYKIKGTLYSLKSRHLENPSLDAVRRYRLGVIKKSAPEFFAHSKGFTHLDYSNEWDQLIKKFFSGRVDTFMAEPRLVSQLAKMLDFDVELLEELWQFQDDLKFYIAATPGFDQAMAQKIRQQLRIEMTRIHQDEKANRR